MKKQLLWLCALAMTVFTACEKSGPTDAEEDAAIQAYITKKGWTAQKTPEGVYYVTDVAGSGSTPAPTNIVSVYYRGYLMDTEAEFDKNLAPNLPSVFPLKNLIEGWQIGFQKFKSGGKGKLIIPSRFGYGSTGSGSKVPAYAILVFEVELVSFK